jgi:glycosyltransferase involved in cell wall biosynthesis
VRTAIVCDSDVFAGTERHLVELVRAMARRGHVPVVACPVPSPVAKQCAAAGATINEINMRGFVDRRAVRALAALLRQDVSILHVHNGRTLLHSVLAKALAGTGRVVSTQHFIRPSRVDRRGVKRWVSDAVHRWVSARVDRHIAISQAVRAEMVRRGDARESRIDVVPNGMEVSSAPPSCDLSALRRREGIDPESRVVFCASRLEREKDVSTLVRAMRVVRDRLGDSVCCIAGDGSVRAEIERLIRELALGDSIRLLGFRTDVAALMSAADLFVLPSVAEPFGLVLLEAMAAGKAVVATRAGGPLEIVVDGETGLLVAPGDGGAMGEAITALLADDARRARMGLAGRRRLEAFFTADRMAEATLAVYRKALTESSGSDAGVKSELFGEPTEITP